MSLFRRKREVVPPGAHGRRNIDGSYFSIWKCQNGHYDTGEPDMPPRPCIKCRWPPLDEIEDWPIPPDFDCGWQLASTEEAHRFVVELEGYERAYDNVGFTLVGGRTP